MFGANAYANHDDFLCYPNKLRRRMPDEDMFGLSPTYRLYECTQGQWIFLALITAREQQRFVKRLIEAGIDNAPTIDLVETGGATLCSALTALFATQTADYWQQLLGGTGVGCVRADDRPPNEFRLEDPQAQAMGLTAQINHPTWGRYARHGPMVTFDGIEPQLGAPPLAGQHNQELLESLGYNIKEIEQLDAQAVLWREPNQ
jgi:crotonobetainyl-CoA:carnitine CoA-transferase CaiB-like acyl-CoA transferase